MPDPKPIFSAPTYGPDFPPCRVIIFDSVIARASGIASGDVWYAPMSVQWAAAQDIASGRTPFPDYPLSDVPRRLVLMAGGTIPAVD